VDCDLPTHDNLIFSTRSPGMDVDALGYNADPGSIDENFVRLRPIYLREPLFCTSRKQIQGLFDILRRRLPSAVPVVALRTTAISL
jgi:hypothetical protein